MAIDPVQDFYNTTVATAWGTTGAGNFYVTTLPTPTNGYVVVNRASSTKREIVKYTGQGTDGGGNYITVASSGDRGKGGTTAQTHTVGETVQMNFTAEHWLDLDTAIDAIVAGGAVDASSSVKGISKLSVSPVAPTTPIAVGDNDTRIPTADPTTLFAPITAIVPDDITQSADIQTQTTSTDTIAVGEADATSKNNSLAQTIVHTKTKIRGVKLYKKADTGTFTGNIVITLQTGLASAPSGTPLATATITNANWLLLSDGAEFDALFASEYDSYVIGDDYCIDIQPSTSDNSNHPNFGGDTSAGDGTVYYNNTTDGWVQIASSYLYFKTMEGNNSQVVKTNTSGEIDSALFSNIPYASGVVSKDISSTSTTSITHGLGITPTRVKITFFNNSATTGNWSHSTGTYDGTSYNCIFGYSDPGTGASVSSSTSIIGRFHANSSQYNETTVSVLTDKLITLAWSKSGSPTGTIPFLWEAFK
jgi:hypothetical protein